MRFIRKGGHIIPIRDSNEIQSAQKQTSSGIKKAYLGLAGYYGASAVAIHQLGQQQKHFRVATGYAQEARRTASVVGMPENLKSAAFAAKKFDAHKAAAAGLRAGKIGLNARRAALGALAIATYGTVQGAAGLIKQTRLGKKKNGK